MKYIKNETNNKEIHDIRFFFLCKICKTIVFHTRTYTKLSVDWVKTCLNFVCCWFPGIKKHTLLHVSFKTHTHSLTHTNIYCNWSKISSKKQERETNKDNFATFVKYHKKRWIKANNKVNSKKLIKNKNITEQKNVLTKLWFITSSGIKNGKETYLNSS